MTVFPDEGPATRARAAHGDPHKVIGAPLPTGDVLRVLIFDTAQGWLHVTEGVAQLLGVPWEMSLLLRRSGLEPSAFPADLFQKLVAYMGASGQRFGHGHRMPLGVGFDDPDSAVRSIYACWDPDAVDEDLLRLVGITDDEREFTDQVASEAFLAEVLGQLPHLVTDPARRSLLTDVVRARALARQVEARDLLLVDNTLSWDERDGAYTVRLEARTWARVVSGAHGVLQGTVGQLVVHGQGVALQLHHHEGPQEVRVDDATLHLTDDLSALPDAREGELVLGGFTVVATGPSETGTATGATSEAGVHGPVEPQPPTLPMPRLRHYLFAYRWLPRVLVSPDARVLLGDGARGKLVSDWHGIQGEGVDPLPTEAEGRIPGRPGRTTLALDVRERVKVGDIDVVFVQMPPAEGPNEAHFVALVYAPKQPYVLSWEKTAGGLAKLGIWAQVNGESFYEHTDADAFATWELFRERVLAEVGQGGPLVTALLLSQVASILKKSDEDAARAMRERARTAAARRSTRSAAPESAAPASTATSTGVPTGNRPPVDEDDGFVNPLIGAVGRVLYIQMALRLLVVVFTLFIGLLGLLVLAFLAEPILAAILWAAALVIGVGLWVGLVVRDRVHEDRWAQALHGEGTQRTVDPGAAFVCTVCASRGGPSDDCARHPGARVDSRDPDNRYAVAQVLTRVQTRRLLMAGGVLVGVSAIAVAVVLFVSSLQCPSGTTYVDPRDGTLAGVTWCEDGEGLKHGEAREYDAMGTLVGQSHWDHGAQVGIETRWHLDGETVLERRTWSAGKPDGLEETYHPDGSSKAMATWVDGELDGEQIEFWPNGRKKSEARFEVGKQVGTARSWYADGTPRSEGEWVDGQPVGEHLTRGAGGTVLERAPYRNGVLHGPYRKVSARGDLIEEGEYVDGEKDRLWTERDATDVYETGTYAAGKREGVWETRDHGSLTARTTWSAGERLGPHEGFHIDGSPAERGSYTHGEKDGVWLSWHSPEKVRLALPAGVAEGGVPAPTIAAEIAALLAVDAEQVVLLDGASALAEAGRYVAGKKQGPWWSWHPSGTPSVSTAFLDGEEDGPYRKWSEDGDVLTVGGHTKGKRDGPWVEVLDAPEGAPSLDGTWTYEGRYLDGHKINTWVARVGGLTVLRNEWVEGLKEGVQTTWDLEGRKLEEGPYEEGSATGTWTTWKDGQVVEKAGYKEGYYHGDQVRYRDGQEVSRTRWDMGKQAL